MDDASPAAIEVHQWKDLDLSAGGRILIEASAGTGKTWTIAVLYLRLLLERGLSPRQIVVATFSEAAAQELRERIRQRVQQALRWASTPDEPVDDEANSWLRERWVDESPPSRDLASLQLAVSELDGAPIGTLHSLCQRILSDYPFETGSQFVSGELISGDSLLAECARDLLRKLVAGDDASAPPSLKELNKRLNILFRPSVNVRVPDPAAARKALPNRAAESLRALAEEKPIFKRTPTGRTSTTLCNALGQLADWLDDGSVVISESNRKHLAERNALVLAEALPELERREEWHLLTQAVDAHDVCQQADQLREWAGQRNLATRWRDERLAARNQLTFDSLLTRANAALQRNPVLADKLLDAWPVALIDELQDTDALQYGVLDRIYRDGDDAARGLLVMIGDPKQAIYSFRGGDIDTYERAAGSAEQRLALEVNRRSDPRLVEATNQFYSLCGPDLSARTPHAIQYRAVKDAGPAPKYLVGGQIISQPLQLHYLKDEREEAGQPGRRSACLDACANQIAGMLASAEHTLDGAPLRPGHIAVLLPTATDIARLRRLLLERGVPCVGSGKSNVFDSDWASEIQLLLHAVRHPHSAPAVRAALSTRLLGFDFGALQEMQVDATAFAQQMELFEALKMLWNEAGVLAVIREIVSKATPRLLACPDGERWLTDLRHLGELIQEAEMQMHGPEQLLAWLASERNGTNGPDDAEGRQLRMESDAHRVRLMTLHASKGLEFPVVFLPMMWNHVHMATLDSINLLPDPAGGRMVGFGAKAQRVYRESGQDERFRVLYVALTRAKHACHVYVMDPTRPAKAGAKAPLPDPERSALDASIERMLRVDPDWQPPDLRQSALQWSEGWPWQHPGRLELGDQEGLRHVRPMPAVTYADERMHSFSSLKHGRVVGLVETAAVDEAGASADKIGSEDSVADQEIVAAPAAPPSPELAELAWIAGAEFGNALHQVLEKRRVDQPISAQHELIDTALRDFGVRLGDMPRQESVARIARRVQAALDADLGGGIRLGDLPARALRAEMGFYYPLRGTSVAALRGACEAYGIGFPEGPSHELEGLMHGKIDLVFEHKGRFHVLDYKGNRLGDRSTGGTLADYAPLALDKQMQDQSYDLQALLYTVALDRFLRGRIDGYDRNLHLGETIYLFVRAAGLAPQAGIWRQRFDDRLLDAVDAALGGKPERVSAEVAA